MDEFPVRQKRVGPGLRNRGEVVGPCQRGHSHIGPHSIMLGEHVVDRRGTRLLAEVPPLCAADCSQNDHEPKGVPHASLTFSS